MNIALEQTEEHVNGRITNRYGDAFIRGNNGALYFRLPMSKKLITLKYYISLLPKNYTDVDEYRLSQLFVHYYFDPVILTLPCVLWILMQLYRYMLWTSLWVRNPTTRS